MLSCSAQSAQHTMKGEWHNNSYFCNQPVHISCYIWNASFVLTRFNQKCYWTNKNNYCKCSTNFFSLTVQTGLVGMLLYHHWPNASMVWFTQLPNWMLVCSLVSDLNCIVAHHLGDLMLKSTIYLFK